MRYACRHLVVNFPQEAQDWVGLVTKVETFSPFFALAGHFLDWH